MTSAKDTQDKAANTADANAAPAKKGRVVVRLVLYGGLLAVFFALPFLASWSYRNHFHHDGDDTAKTHDDAGKAAPPKSEGSANPAELLGRGDRALEELHFSEALAHYTDYLGLESAKGGLVSYRVALCHESLGTLDAAMASYRRVIEAAPSAATSFAAHLGLARCLLRRHEAFAARRLLAPFFVDESRQQELPTAIFSEARYLTALSFAREEHHPTKIHVIDDDPVPASLVPLNFPFYLDEIAASLKRDDAIQAHAPAAEPATRINDPKGAAAFSQDGAAIEVIDALAAMAGKTTSWTEAAKKSLHTRPLRVRCPKGSSAETLETVADSLELVCHEQEATVRFSRLTEADTKSRAEFRHRLAERALRAAIVGDASHPLAPAAYIELGNADFASQKWVDAAMWYDRVLKETPSSPFAVLAHTNLARLHMRKAEYADARSQFFRVMDQAPGHELAIKARLRIGQLCLEEGAVKEAIAQLKQVQTLAPQSPSQSLIVLVTAAAHLQNGEPEKCRAALAKSATQLRHPPLKTDAAILDALAQFRMSRAHANSRREASELLSTILTDGDDSVLGPFGQWLVASAYRDLGFRDQAERLLRLAAAQPKSPFSNRITFSLAELLASGNQFEEASRLFESLTSVAGPLSSRARLQLASIDLSERRFKACSEKCRTLWRQPGDVQPAEILRLWGAALEGTGEFEKASDCFAGKAPE